MGRVRLKPRRDHATRHRHPWIFSGAIAEDAAGERRGGTVEVVSSDGERLGWGSWSPESQIRVRMLAYGDAPEPGAKEIAELVAGSVRRRAGLRESGLTNAYRAVNAESDGLPGVTADVYGDFAVVQLASAGAERWKAEIASALMESVPGCRGVYNRSDVDARAREGLAQEKGAIAGEEPPETIEVIEGAIKYLVDVRAGHKTGFYLDQRDARAAVGAVSRGCDMLNCFSYTGGFGLAACAGGAKSVTHLDVSAEALRMARLNTELNGPACECAFEEADVFRKLRQYRDSRRTFDLIVLDPPKFADSKGALMRALRGYKDINLLAMKLLRPGGALATFSCSGAVTAETFEKVCAEAAHDAGRSMQIAMRTSQAAADHPVSLSFPEGAYLKGLVLRAMD